MAAASWRMRRQRVGHASPVCVGAVTPTRPRRCWSRRVHPRAWAGSRVELRAGALYTRCRAAAAALVLVAAAAGRVTSAVSCIGRGSPPGECRAAERAEARGLRGVGRCVGGSAAGRPGAEPDVQQTAGAYRLFVTLATRPRACGARCSAGRRARGVVVLDPPTAHAAPIAGRYSRPRREFVSSAGRVSFRVVGDCRNRVALAERGHVRRIAEAWDRTARGRAAAHRTSCGSGGPAARIRRCRLLGRPILPPVPSRRSRTGVTRPSSVPCSAAEPHAAADRRLIRAFRWLAAPGRGLLPGRLLSFLFGGGSPEPAEGGPGWMRGSSSAGSSTPMTAGCTTFGSRGWTSRAWWQRSSSSAPARPSPPTPASGTPDWSGTAHRRRLPGRGSVGGSRGGRGVPRPRPRLGVRGSHAARLGRVRVAGRSDARLPHGQGWGPPQLTALFDLLRQPRSRGGRPGVELGSGAGAAVSQQFSGELKAYSAGCAAAAAPGTSLE